MFSEENWHRMKSFLLHNSKLPGNYIDVTEPLENMKQLPDDWIKIIDTRQNKLYDKFRSVTDYRFHRGSGKVDEIENTFKLVNRQERAFGNLNKMVSSRYT